MSDFAIIVTPDNDKNELQQVLDDIKTDKETNLLPENLKKGITCLGVEGTLEGGSGTDVPVKLFKSIEEMNSSINKKAGDLAVVYSETIDNWKVDTKSNIMIFPETVVLDKKVTSAYLDFKVADGSPFSISFWGNLESRYMFFEITSGDLRVSVDYSSQDGITFTKSQGDDKIELPVEVEYKFPEEWDEVIGYFIRTVYCNFNGVYKCQKLIDNTYYLTTSIKNIDDVNSREQRICRLPEINNILTTKNDEMQFFVDIKEMQKYTDGRFPDRDDLWEAITYDIWQYTGGSLNEGCMYKGTAQYQLGTSFSQEWIKYTVVNKEITDEHTYSEKDEIKTTINPLQCGEDDFVQGIYHYEVDVRDMIRIRDDDGTWYDVGLTEVPVELSYLEYNELIK